MSPAWCLCLLLVTGLALAPTAANDRKTEEERAKEKRIEALKEEIETVNRAFTKHARNHNCAAIMDIYDPGTMAITYDSTMHGLDVMKDILGEVHDGLVSFNMTTDMITTLGKHEKFVFQKARYTANDFNGQKMYSGESFVIWKRNHNGLKAFIEVLDMDE